MRTTAPLTGSTRLSLGPVGLAVWLFVVVPLATVFWLIASLVLLTWRLLRALVLLGIRTVQTVKARP